MSENNNTGVIKHTFLSDNEQPEPLEAAQTPQHVLPQMWPAANTTYIQTSVHPSIRNIMTIPLLAEG